MVVPDGVLCESFPHSPLFKEGAFLIMNKVSGMLLSVAFFSVTCFSGSIEFNAAEFKDQGKMASKLVDASLKNLKKHGIKKVVIMECYGEFLTSKETADAFNNFSYAGGGSTLDSMMLGGDYYRNVADYVYDQVKKEFEDNGIAVVVKDSVINNPAYADVGLKAEAKGGGYTHGGMTSRAKITQTAKASTTGMGLFPTSITGIGATVKLRKVVPQIIRENGSDAALRISFFVDKGDHGTPVLSKLTITMSSNLDSANAGKGKKDYYFKSENDQILAMKKAVTSTVDIRGAEKGTVDMGKYNSALTEIIQGVSSLYTGSIRDFLAEK
jgi:hypothetical protein